MRKELIVSLVALFGLSFCLVSLAADFNGDGTNDLGVFRESNGLWAIKDITRDYFGGSGDAPLPGDYNGDGVSDFGIFRASTGLWAVRGVTRDYFGSSVDEPLVGVGGGSPWRQDESNIYYDGGDVGIGTTDPYDRLHVRDNSDYGQVVRIENISSNSNADALMLRINKNHPGTSNEFILFYQDVGNVGAIRGSGDGGVQYISSTSDFAECLPRLSADEVIEAAEIVGLSGGKVSKITRGAEQVQVISSGSIVLGNHPGKEKEHLYEEVAFLGQAPVKVQGPVRSGDYIVPSGQNDGVGVAVSPGNLTSAHCARIVGRAWEASEEDGIKLINTVVGLNSSTQAVKELSLRKDRQITQLTARLEALERIVKEMKE